MNLRSGFSLRLFATLPRPIESLGFLGCPLLSYGMWGIGGLWPDRLSVQRMTENPIPQESPDVRNFKRIGLPKGLFKEG